ncbi:saccharopine dehydrogenase NADP-binding domain-containing protein [Lutibacter sp.]
MSNIIVLGAGMVGSTMAIDMAKKHLVTITDFNKKTLEKAIKKCDKLIPEVLDVTNKDELQKLIKPFDLVICAVPGFLGFETLKSIIEAKKM